MKKRHHQSNDYQPINCDFYDELEAAATLNQRCEITYEDNNKNHIDTISKVLDLYTHDGVEYAKLEDNLIIRLDHIVRLNGKTEPDHQESEQVALLDTKLMAAKGIVEVWHNDNYRLVVDKMRNRIYITYKNLWKDFETVRDLNYQLLTIIKHLEPGFTLLNDLTMITPDANNTIEMPHMPARSGMIKAGLYKVADVIPEECQTLLHGLHSFSVNSVKNRSFKSLSTAEHWLDEGSYYVSPYGQ